MKINKIALLRYAASGALPAAVGFFNSKFCTSGTNPFHVYEAFLKRRMSMLWWGIAAFTATAITAVLCVLVAGKYWGLFSIPTLLLLGGVFLLFARRAACGNETQHRFIQDFWAPNPSALTSMRWEAEFLDVYMKMMGIFGRDELERVKDDCVAFRDQIIGNLTRQVIGMLSTKFIPDVGKEASINITSWSYDDAHLTAQKLGVPLATIGQIQDFLKAANSADPMKSFGELIEQIRGIWSYPHQ